MWALITRVEPFFVLGTRRQLWCAINVDFCVVVATHTLATYEWRHDQPWTVEHIMGMPVGST